MLKCRILATAFAATVLALGSTAAVAQSSRTIKIIVPYTPGSGPDITSRLMGEQIQKAGGPTVVVENRPGGGMTIGTEAAARAEPDGNTLLLVANAFVVNMATKRGSFTLANFEPVCNIASTPMPLVVQANAPWKTVQELVADAKANPGKITFASGGPATSLHIAIEVLRLATKIDVNYRCDSSWSRRHDDHSIRQVNSFRYRVRYKYNCCRGLTTNTQQFALHIFASHFVERTKWLIHEQQRWVCSKSTSNCNSLLHAARQLPRIQIGKLWQLNKFEHLFGSRFTLGFVPTFKFKWQLDIFTYSSPIK